MGRRVLHRDLALLLEQRLTNACWNRLRPCRRIRHLERLKSLPLFAIEHCRAVTLPLVVLVVALSLRKAPAWTVTVDDRESESRVERPNRRIFSEFTIYETVKGSL